jgi:hypothetical protein
MQDHTTGDKRQHPNAWKQRSKMERMMGSSKLIQIKCFVKFRETACYTELLQSCTTPGNLAAL